MAELKPCPICGKYPQVDLDDDGYFLIGCGTIDCWNNTLGGINTKQFNTEDDAFTAWSWMCESWEVENGGAE